MYASTPDESWDDSSLLEHWLKGSVAAGELLFARHERAIRAYFKGKRRSDIDDLVQVTFLAFLEGKVRFRGDSCVRTYLLAIAQRQLWTEYRRGQRDYSDLVLLLDDGSSPLALLTSREQDRRVLGTLDRLPADLRTVLHLRYWEGLSTKQMALSLGVPIGTVASRLRRARTLVREFLQSDSPPG